MKMKKILLMLALTSLLLTNGCIYTSRNGSYDGQITAVEENGIIWFEHAIYVKSVVSSSQEESYCIGDRLDLLPTVEELSKTKARVTIKYRDNLPIIYYGASNGRAC